MARKRDIPNVVWHTNEQKEAGEAVDKIITALNQRILDVGGGLVRIRNVIADEMVIQIQNKIWENKSIVTGRLWGSITRNPENLNPDLEISIHTPVDVGTNVFYAPFVEAKKPFMKPTFEKEVSFWKGRFEDEVRDEVG